MTEGSRYGGWLSPGGVWSIFSSSIFSTTGDRVSRSLPVDDEFSPLLSVHRVRNWDLVFSHVQVENAAHPWLRGEEVLVAAPKRGSPGVLAARLRFFGGCGGQDGRGRKEAVPGKEKREQGGEEMRKIIARVPGGGKGEGAQVVEFAQGAKERTRGGGNLTPPTPLISLQVILCLVMH